MLTRMLSAVLGVLLVLGTVSGAQVPTAEDAAVMRAADAPRAQAGASLTGIVTNPEGAAVVEAPIQARNTSTGAVSRTTSGSDGRYRFINLAAGTYQLSIAMPCCAFNRFTRDGILLEPGQATQVDVRLVGTLARDTLGDDPFTLAEAIRKRSPAPAGPVPRLPDGRPDLSGMWLVRRDLYPEEPAVLPSVAPVVRERVASNRKDDPQNRCLPGSMPVPTVTPPWLAKIIHTPSLLVVLFEGNPGYRQVFLDGRHHPENFDPSWMGHSVGKWEGETLVVETVGFNDRGWVLGPYPRTEQLRIVERYTRTERGRLQVSMVLEDPGVFAKPWNVQMGWHLAPEEELLEYVCENNITTHIVGK